MNEHRDNSGRLTFDFNSVESGMYSKITKSVVTTFSLDPASGKTSGLDEAFQEFRRGDNIVGLHWDNWSGYIVNAKVTSAEPLAREIAVYVSAKFDS